MHRFIFAVVFWASGASHAADWVVLTSDESSRILLDLASVERKAPDEVRFRVKRIHSGQKDMMGLQYNATLGRYVLACDSGIVMFRQQFLLKDDEVVWTFPESGKAQKASQELSDAVIGAVCKPAADAPR